MKYKYQIEKENNREELKKKNGGKCYWLVENAMVPMVGKWMASKDANGYVWPYDVWNIHKKNKYTNTDTHTHIYKSYRY